MLINIPFDFDMPLPFLDQIANSIQLLLNIALLIRLIYPKRIHLPTPFQVLINFRKNFRIMLLRQLGNHYLILQRVDLYFWKMIYHFVDWNYLLMKDFVMFCSR